MTKTVSVDPTVAALRARLGGYRSRPQNDPEVLATKAALAEATLMSAIERLIAGAPPFTPEQSFRLRNLLDAKAVSNG